VGDIVVVVVVGNIVVVVVVVGNIVVVVVVASAGESVHQHSFQH